MTQLVEYIIQNYTWFLGGTILILLAIIGYYADKTNFGQNKLKDIKSDEENFLNNNLEENVLTKENDVIQQNNLNKEKMGVELDDSNFEVNYDTMTEESILKDDFSKVSTGNLIDSFNTLEQEIQVENINDEVEYNPNKISDVLSANNINKKEIEVKEKVSVALNEEEIEKFNQEFNSILPEKELISDDLLSDIDDLRLDKTQKIDLSGIPNLDDIELPKIKNLVQKEQDIWKF